MPTVKLSPVYNGYNDNNGVPNSGGKVTVNIAGTTTPATIYTDASGTIANTNPIILDSRGVPIDPIWLPVGASYDLSMTTSTDVPLTHVYNVTGVNDADITSGSEWVNSGLTTEYISATSFKVPVDATAYLLPYTRLKIAYLTGYIYSSVVTAVYAAGFTTVTVSNDSTALASGIGALFYGVLSPVNLSVPLTARRNSGENILINPSMLINVEGLPTATATGVFSCDSWQLIASAGLSGSIEQARSTTVPAYNEAGRQLAYSLKTYTSIAKPTMASGDFLTARQNIEGYQVAKIYRQPFCIRFWAYATTAGDYSVSFASPSSAYTCVLKYTVALASTWQLIELDVPACPSAGGWVFTNAIGMTIDFTVDAGTTFKTANLSAWQSGNYLACTTQAAGATVGNGGLFIADVEIQKGTIGSTWRCETRPEPIEIQLCSRYYQKMQAGMYFYGANAVIAGHTINFPSVMRAAPTITAAGVSYTSCSALAFAAITDYCAMATVTGGTNGMMSVTMSSLSLNSRI